jgi:membrane protease YdiL (CAAX protease family)
MNKYKNLSPGLKILFSLFIVFAAFTITLFVSAIIGMVIFKNGFLSLLDQASIFSEENIVILKYFQTIQSIGLFVLPPILIALIFGNNIDSYLKLNVSPKSTSFILTAVLLLFAMPPLINFLAEINSNMQLPGIFSGVEDWMKNMEENAMELTELFLDTKTVGGFLFNIFMIAVLPAIGEELMFRGVLQKQFSDWFRNNHMAIWFTAFLFSAMHMQFYGFLPRFFLGVIFGYLFFWSGSIWLPIIAHFINNTIAVTVYFLINNGKINESVEEIGTTGHGSLIYLPISIILIAVILFQIYKQEEKPTTA